MNFFFRLSGNTTHTQKKEKKVPVWKGKRRRERDEDDRKVRRKSTDHVSWITRVPSSHLRAFSPIVDNCSPAFGAHKKSRRRKLKEDLNAIPLYLNPINRRTYIFSFRQDGGDGNRPLWVAYFSFRKLVFFFFCSPLGDTNIERIDGKRGKNMCRKNFPSSLYI